MLISFSFNFRLLANALWRGLLQTNFTKTGLGFVLTESNFLTLWVLSIFYSKISIIRCSDIVQITTSSVFSVLFSGKPYTNTQVRLEYCSCLSVFCSRLTILLVALFYYFLINIFFLLFPLCLFRIHEFRRDEIKRFL